MLSLPIPSPDESALLGDIRLEGIDVGSLAADLTNGRCDAASTVHMDPDLCGSSLAERPAGWMPAFGQVGAAQSHLEAQGVTTGDLFLFFGWFRCVEHLAGRWRFRPAAADLHVLFGWLQIGEVVRVLDATQALSDRPWLEGHPHVKGLDGYSANNTIYTAAPRLGLSTAYELAGGGTFCCFDPVRCLTAPGATRSVWSLPSALKPAEGRPPLTYHGNPARWQSREDRVLLQTVGKGQEFVLDCARYPDVETWLASLFRDQR
jgi:hypothetical protein